ncbi:MAG: hypothetical protein NUV67_04335 [archaeon]|nr:hypothetical protein [archaeon]
MLFSPKNAIIGLALVANASIVFAQDYAWDVLRPFSEFAAAIDMPVKFIVLLLALSIFVISLLAYNKTRSKRLLLVSIAFFLFSTKWIVKILDLYVSPGAFLSDSSENIFELGIMFSLLIALFYNDSWKKKFGAGGK